MNYHIIIDLLIYLFGFLEFIFVVEVSVMCRPSWP